MIFEKPQHMENDFEWTDEKVKDFLQWKEKVRSPLVRESLTDQIGEFKKQNPKKYPKGILKFINASGQYNELSNDDHYDYWCEYNFRDECKIFKVQNSRGEAFSVGDEIDGQRPFTNQQSKILAFKIIDSEMGFNPIGIYANVDNFSWEFIDLIHPKKEIFKTEDGHELRDGQKYYMVWNTDYLLREIIHDQGEYESRGNLGGSFIFRYLSNANDFIKENKPMFSKKQIKDALFGNGRVDGFSPNYGIINKSKFGI